MFNIEDIKIIVETLPKSPQWERAKYNVKEAGDRKRRLFISALCGRMQGAGFCDLATEMLSILEMGYLNE